MIVAFEITVANSRRESVREQPPRAFSITLGLLALSVFINYIDRGNLPIAAPILKDELGISASELGILLSSFFSVGRGWSLE